MTFINYAAREINCKIVYYGPGLGGKTTNIQYIHERTRADAKGKLISLATETDRTLFFDFLPIELGTIRGFKTRFHLYTVPGQVFYDASRKLILKGVDGLVFVADSQELRYDANLEAISNLRSNLKDHGLRNGHPQSSVRCLVKPSSTGLSCSGLQRGRPRYRADWVRPRNHHWQSKRHHVGPSHLQAGRQRDRKYRYRK